MHLLHKRKEDYENRDDRFFEVIKPDHITKPAQHNTDFTNQFTYILHKKRRLEKQKQSFFSHKPSYFRKRTAQWPFPEIVFHNSNHQVAGADTGAKMNLLKIARFPDFSQCFPDLFTTIPRFFTNKIFQGSCKRCGSLNPALGR